MKTYLDAIFGAKTTADVCSELQDALDALRKNGYLEKLPNDYEDVSANDPDDVQDWCDGMRDDKRAKEEGHLREIYDLFTAALSRLRDLGFHREYE